MNKKIQRAGFFLAIVLLVSGTAWSDSVSDRRQCDQTCFELEGRYYEMSDEFQKEVNNCQARYGNVDWVKDHKASDRFHRCEDPVREFNFAAGVWESKVCRVACVEGSYDFVRETDWMGAGREAYANYQMKWASKPLNTHFELDLSTRRLEDDGISALHDAIKQRNRGTARTVNPAAVTRDDSLAHLKRD